MQFLIVLPRVKLACLVFSSHRKIFLKRTIPCKHENLFTFDQFVKCFFFFFLFFTQLLVLGTLLVAYIVTEFRET